MTPPSKEDLRALRVMVVEDDAATRLLIRMYLEHLHLDDVTERENGEAAFKDLTRRHYDLIVTDLEMQPMSGWDILHRIRRDPNVTNPYVPVILITQHANREAVIKARDYGASAFVAKPVDFKNLQRTIMTVLSDSRPFVKADSYTGPDRRRQDTLPKGGKYKREDDYRW